MKKFRILVLDHVAPRGVELLQAESSFDVIVKSPLKEAELVQSISDMDAVVVRSQTKVTRPAIEAAQKLKVIGRAGVGVDNVDVDAATQRGVIVMNTPGGNTISTAEHTFSMMLSMARSIPQAHASMKEGKWDRKTFVGVEMYGKTLGIIGLGRIGSEVAKRALGFGMKVLAYDPFISLTRAKSLNVEVVELQQLIERADIITVHMPLSEKTQGMLGREAFSKMKKGVRILNCARGGIVDEKALAEAILSGKVAGAALDVFEQEPPATDHPLRSLPQVITTPHLGASTNEAQESVGIEIAEAIRAYLMQGEIQNAVNVPSVDAKTMETLRPYLDLGEKMGRLLSQLSQDRVEQLTINYYGPISTQNTQPITRLIVKGFLERTSGRNINQVNAMSQANDLGMKVSENRTESLTDYSELIEVVAQSTQEKHSMAATFFNSTNHPRIVRIDGHNVEATPQGILLLTSNKDRPGMVGWIGNILAKHQLNIASMSLSRNEIGGRALNLLNLDSAPSETALSEITSNPDFYWVKVIKA